MTAHDGMQREGLGGEPSPEPRKADEPIESDESISEAAEPGNGQEQDHLAHALMYQHMGFSVIPLHRVGRSREGTLVCNCGRDCGRVGKHPLIEWKDYENTAATEEQVRKWWWRWPKAGVGIVTGEISGLAVVDVDGEQGVQSLKEAGIVLPETVTVETGGGGWHHWYRYPPEGVTTRAGILTKVDTRGHGGFIVAPPTIHKALYRYSFMEGHGPDEIKLAEFPQEVAELLRAAPQQPSVRKVVESSGILDGVPEGQRDEAIFRYALSRLRLGVRQAEVEALVQEKAARCDPPFPPEEALAKVRSALNYLNDVERRCEISDMGNAQRLAVRHGQDLRYCHAWKKWLVWDGRRWREDSTGEVIERAKETIRSLYQQAADIDDSGRRLDFVKRVMRFEAAPRVNAMVELARSEKGIAILPEQLDSDPWKLTVANGTIDLRTGKLLPHQREDLITMLAPASFDPEAISELLDGFLQRILPDSEVRSFVQRAAGYSVYGGTDEEILLFAYGPPATGKSTLFRAISATLGDYAATADFDTFLKRNYVSGGPRNDVARLAGKRFVVSLEVDEGATLAESLVNQLTGSDTVAARHLYRESFEFRPQFTIWLAANNRPRIEGMDGGIWRRIREVPFDQEIPESERDPNLKKNLSDPEKHGSAILNWLLEGCLAWQRERLGMPTAVKEATEEYREEMDQVREFMTDCIIRKEGHQVNNGVMWDTYLKWCKRTGVQPLGRKQFSGSLKEKGLVQRDSGGRRYWPDVRIAPTDDSAIEIGTLTVHGKQVLPRPSLN